MLNEKQLLLQQIKNIFKLFRKYIVIVVFVLILFVISGLVISQKFVTPIYESTTKIYVHPQSKNGSVNSDQMEFSKNLAGDCVEIVQSFYVLERALEEAQLSDQMSAEELQKQIYVATDYESRIIHLSVYDVDKDRAKKLANEISNALVVRAKEILGGDWCSVWDKAHVKDKPFYPNVSSVIFESFLFGVMFLFLLAVILVIMNDRIYNRSDVEQYLNITVLGEIPKKKK